MQPTPILCLILLFALLTPAFPDLIRLPIKKHRKQKRSSSTSFLNLNSVSFAGSMKIEDFSDLAYSAPISIGSNSQEFNFQLDTGSSNLWIPGTAMSGQVSNTFDCSKSTTCNVDYSDSITLSYEIGSTSGYKATDQVTLGSLTIPNFDILIATSVSDPSQNYDGLVGLALGTNNQTYPIFPTVLDSLKSNRLISVGMFSMYLGNDPTSSGSHTGEIIFGGYDPEYAASSFQYVNVYTAEQSMYWTANLTALGYGTSQNLSSGPLPVIFDSGTSLMLLSQEMFNNLQTAAMAQGIYFSDNSDGQLQVVDCSAQTKLDNLTFYFEGATFNISASNYIVSGSDYCYLGFSVQSGYINLGNPLILGDTFLNNYYAMYTADNHTVGFADPAPIKGFPVWAIILIVIGGIVLIGLGIYAYRKYKSRSVSNASNTQPFAGRGMVIGGAL